MVKVNCASCGENVEIDRTMAYEQITAHLKMCKPLVLICPTCNKPLKLSKRGDTLQNVVQTVFKHLKTCKNAK